MEQDIFYLNARDKLPSVWEEICRDAKKRCNHWRVDDQPTWQRREIEMDFDEVLKYLYRFKIHFSIIHRRNQPGGPHLEIGFCTINRKDSNGDLFLWIYLDIKHLDYFVKEYGLK